MSVFQSGGKSYFTSLLAVFYEDFSFSTSLPILGITCLFHYGHSNGCEVVSYCGSNWTNDAEHLPQKVSNCDVLMCISIFPSAFYLLPQMFMEGTAWPHVQLISGCAFSMMLLSQAGIFFLLPEHFPFSAPCSLGLLKIPICVKYLSHLSLWVVPVCIN